MPCSQCGADVQPEFLFCPMCGHPIPSQTEPEDPTPTVVDTPSGSDWILAIMSGNDQGSSYPFLDTLIIGRAEACDVVLNDERASRRHATIERTGEDSFRLVDHGSTNGTFVNESRVAGTAILLAGTPVRIGDTVMSLVPTFETCARCGQRIEGSISFCGECGHPIGAEAEIDLEAMAAEIERAASRAPRPPSAPPADAGVTAPNAAGPTTTGSSLSGLFAKLSGRRFIVGCLGLIILSIIAGLLGEVLQDLFGF